MKIESNYSASAINHEKLHLLERLKFLKSKSLKKYEIIVPYEKFRKSCPGEVLLEFENGKEEFKDKSKKITLMSKGGYFSLRVNLVKNNSLDKILDKIYSKKQKISLWMNDAMIEWMNDAMIEIIKREHFNNFVINICFDTQIDHEIKINSLSYGISKEYIRCCDYKLWYHKNSITKKEILIISLYFDNENEALEVYDNDDYINYITQRFRRFLEFEKEERDIIQKIREVDNLHEEENDKEHSKQINYLDFLSDKDNWVKNIIYESERCILIKVPEKQGY